MNKRWKVEMYFLSREAAKRFRDALLVFNPDFRPLMVPVQSSAPKVNNVDS